MAQLFGFEIKRVNKEPDLPAIVAPVSDDGAVVVSGGGVFGQFVDLDGTVRTEGELVNKYREMAEHPEMEAAIDDITNEAVVVEEETDVVRILLEDILTVGVPEQIKEVIEAEFKNVLMLLEFTTHPYELFKRWYIDGRLYFEVLIDEKDPQAGIQQLRYIDPRKIRKIREVKESRDPRTGAPLKQTVAEYYLYNDKGFSTQGSAISTSANPSNSTGVKIAKDSVIHCTSGISSAKGDIILSYLHKAIKPLNQLRSLEDSLVIYRISRAPERRIFYIDIGNLSKIKAEQYLRDIMTRFANKIVYDANDGSIRDDRKFMTMMEDFFLPRREGGRGTEITTLPGGQNLNQIDDIIFFQRKLFRSLNVPITRLDPEALFNYGRANEITRDEVKFAKFIQRLRVKFSELFTKTLGTQLMLKNIVTPEEWDSIKYLIKYRYATDSYFEELKESEIFQGRLNTAAMMEPYIGRYFSNHWMMTHIFRMEEEDIQRQQQEIMSEFNNPLYYPPEMPAATEDNVPAGAMQSPPGAAPGSTGSVTGPRPKPSQRSLGPKGKNPGKKPNRPVN